jgi:hypothetical protein
VCTYHLGEMEAGDRSILYMFCSERSPSNKLLKLFTKYKVFVSFGLQPLSLWGRAVKRATFGCAHCCQTNCARHLQPSYKCLSQLVHGPGCVGYLCPGLWKSLAQVSIFSHLFLTNTIILPSDDGDTLYPYFFLILCPVIYAVIFPG